MYEWCEAHYDDSTRQKIVNLVEETVELGMVLPVEAGRMTDACSAAHPDVSLHEAASRVRHAFRVLAGAAGIDYSAAVNDVMALNRRRTPAECAARAARKRKLGLIG